MGIPIHRASKQSSAHTGLRSVPVAQLTETGEEAAWLASTDAAAGAMQSVSDYSQMDQDAEDRTKLSTAERKRDERVYAALDEIKNTPDVSEHQKIMETALADIDTFTPEHRWVADAYKASTDNRRPHFQARAKKVSDQIRKNNIEAENRVNWESAVERGDHEQLENIVADNVTNIIWPKGDARRFLADARKTIDVNSVREAIYSDPSAALKMINSKEFTNDHPHIGTEEKIALIREAEMRENYGRRVASEVLEQQRESERDMIFDAVNGKLQNEDGTERLLTYEDIEGTSLDEREKQHYWKLLKDAYKGSEGLEYKLSTPKAYADIAERIYTGQEVAKKEIWQMVGRKKGDRLSTKDAEKLSKELDSRNRGQSDPVVDMRKKIGVKQLEDVFEKGGKWGEDESKESIELFQKRLNQWDRFWEKNPEASDKEAGEFMESLTEDVYNQLTNNYNTKKIADIDSEIEAELAEFALSGGVEMFDTGTDPNNLQEDAFVYEGAEIVKGDTFVVDGVIYEYLGDGKAKKLWD